MILTWRRFTKKKRPTSKSRKKITSAKKGILEDSVRVERPSTANIMLMNCAAWEPLPPLPTCSRAAGRELDRRVLRAFD